MCRRVQKELKKKKNMTKKRMPQTKTTMMWKVVLTNQESLVGARERTFEETMTWKGFLMLYLEKRKI